MAATPKVNWPEIMTQLLCLPKRKGKCFGEQLYSLASCTVQFYAHIDCPQSKSAHIKYQCTQIQQTVHAYYMYVLFGHKIEQLSLLHSLSSLLLLSIPSPETLQISRAECIF